MVLKTLQFNIIFKALVPHADSITPINLRDLTAVSKCHGIAIGNTNDVLLGQTPIETVTSTKRNSLKGEKRIK